jgi:hypothetical protein
MTPTLSGRIQTRLLLLALIGAPWTAIVTPILPRPGWVPLSMLYDIMFRGLGLVAIVGIAWEVAYHAVQQLRWDKDWPSLLQLLVMVNEALVIWLILHATGTIPGTAAITAPLVPAYTIFFASTWTLIWLAMHGPLRVVALRWRFEGARILPHRAHPRDEQPPGAPSAPPPTAAPTRRPGAHPPMAPEVEGVECGKGHFNHPRSAYCATCGVSLRQDGARTSTGPRPPLGALVFDTGRRAPLDTDYVLGARPNRDPRVRAGQAKPLALRGPDGSVAAAHLDIVLDGWHVQVCDRGSASGTRVAHADSTEWAALPPCQPVRIAGGARLRVGGRTVVIESHWPLEPPQAPPPSRATPPAKPAAGRHRAPAGSRHHPRHTHPDRASEDAQ